MGSKVAVRRERDSTLKLRPQRSRRTSSEEYRIFAGMVSKYCQVPWCVINIIITYSRTSHRRSAAGGWYGRGERLGVHHFFSVGSTGTGILFWRVCRWLHAWVGCSQFQKREQVWRSIWSHPGKHLFFLKQGSCALAYEATEVQHQPSSWLVTNHEWAQPNGYGVEYYASGAIFQGQFQKHLRHGLGVYSFPSGLSYGGGFSKGNQHGEGVEYTELPIFNDPGT